MSPSDDAREPQQASTDEPADKGEKKSAAKTKSKAKAKDKKKRPGPWSRFRLFLRQVVAELRKVIWPTRSELINYTIVVLVFVVIMALILALYDFAFAKLVFWVFGGK